MNYKYIGIFVFIALVALVIIFNKGDISLTGQNNFKLQPISSSGYILESDIHLYNPNILSSTIKNIHEEFRLNGKVLGILDQEIQQGIPGRKESVFPVSIRFSKDDYDRAVGNDSTSASKAKITVDGEIAFINVVSGGKIEVHQSAGDSVGRP